MLQCQRDKLQERGRLRAQGFTDEQIRQAEMSRLHAFRPAFENGKRRRSEEADGCQAPTGLKSFHRPA